MLTILTQKSSVFSQLSASQSVYARLNFANSLTQIKNEQLQQLAIQYAELALKTAQTLDNRRLISYSLGTLGKLYKQTERLSQAYLEQALYLAQSIRASDLAYQWQQQLGQLYQKQGKYKKAVEAYEAAVNNLERVRSNIGASNPDVQFSFREQVEPVYREYMRLLLADANPNLSLVIQTNERLQLAELENFLQCGKLDLVALSDINVTQPPGVIQIINLGDRVEVIVQSSDRSLHRHTPNPELVRRNSENLLLNLQDKNFAGTDEKIIISYSQALYNLLIAPVKKYLPNSGTLVFVLDSSLQNIPMSLLHDGQNYLLKNYSISVTLSSQLRPPKVLQKGHLKALVAGISQKSPSFQDPNVPKGLLPLPEVETEVKDIKENTVSTVALLNEKFTLARFQQEINTSVFPIVHITTHSQFSSDPEQTVILAWDRAINVQQLNRLLKSEIQTERDGIELLALSACQTAKGDKKSALGIAGVAAQAGARSTVATLWLVDVKSTAQLMGEFYKGLKGGMAKAEALRQAQISLLSNPKYQHPYYWAPFILVGSWL